MVVKWRMAVISFALLLLAAAAQAENRKPLVQTGDRVAIFGDSISTGKGYGWYAINMINAQRPDLKLVWLENGHPGWTAINALTVVDDVIAQKPDLVTIMFGTNDLGYQGARAVAEIKDRIRKLVLPFKEKGIRVIILTTPMCNPNSSFTRECNRVLPKMGRDLIDLAEEENVPVLDMFAAMKIAWEREKFRNPEFQMFRDGVHPSDEGHKVIGRILADFLLGQDRPTGHAVRAVHLSTGELIWREDTPLMRLDDRSQICLPSSWKGPEDLSAAAQAAWDDKALYLNVQVRDDVILSGEKQPAWGHDGIEFFFDTRPEAKRTSAFGPGYFQMLVAVPAQNGPAPVACGRLSKFDTSLVSATCIRTENSYMFNITLPWKAFDFAPKAGGNIGFDFAINDRDKQDVDRYKALWRGAGDDYINAGLLGVLEFD